MNHNYKIKREDAEKRLDKFLADKNPEYSRQEVQIWIKNGYVKVNNKIKKAKYMVKFADHVDWEIPEKEARIIKAEDLPLNILYEDDSIIVINKDKGMLVHPTQHITSGTLVNAIMSHSKKLSNVNGDERPGIVHRLDKDTSGIILVAKTNKAHLSLQEQFAAHTVYRQYEAIVFGVVNHDNGIINAPIGRDPNNRLRMAVTSSGKKAETHFNVIERFNQHSYLSCELITGRTHQIRVHMKYMQHPIVGDPVYCRKKSKLLSSQALFAKALTFKHPITDKKFSFEVERPQYFETLLSQLRKMA